ncbi:fra a 1-associated protein [Cucumis melo]|uniref:Fra a 1-associated protein n=1 Tax=Cucumis melo TaxID=3656 RepID=A0A1S3B6X7_CUCME|nr:fra a 1-associated protein [Cucumis melo]
MGWVWRDDTGDLDSSAVDGAKFDNSTYPSSSDRCSTRNVVRSHCKTEEVEPGKFVRKCERTEEILRDCIGRPTEVIQSNKEFTEEDVTDQMVNRSFPLGSSEHRPFDFPGLRSDIDAIEQSLFGSMKGFFEAAEEIKNGFFGSLRDPPLFNRDSSSPGSMRRGIPIEDHDPEFFSNPKEPDSGHVDLSGLARDV